MSHINCQESGQDTTKFRSIKSTHPGLKNNALYFTAGFFGGVIINGNYERILWQNQHLFLRCLQLRVGIGKTWMQGLSGFISTTNYELRTYTGTMGLLAGRRNSFLEFGIGASYFEGSAITTSGWTGNSVESAYDELLPALMLGYRFQQPGNSFVFRTGLGIPDGLYISLGFAF